MEKNLFLGTGCTFDGCRKVVYAAKVHSFLSEFLLTKRSACQKLKPPPYFQCMQFLELLRVPLQLDMKLLFFGEVIADFYLMTPWKEIRRVSFP